VFGAKAFGYGIGDLFRGVAFDEPQFGIYMAARLPQEEIPDLRGGMDTQERLELSQRRIQGAVTRGVYQDLLRGRS